ncbi:MAG: aldo/keto reductase [Acholeplasmataceae bacterium]
MKVIDQFFTLNNGVKLPKIGFGTWQIKDGDDAYNSVLTALKNGYRHIDTAASYGNEYSVGRAIKDSKIPREEIFVTTKLQSHIKTYEGALKAFDTSLNALDLDYIDLYLIHAPWPWRDVGNADHEGNVLAYQAMESLYKAGKVRAIGISNFDPKDIDNIIKHCKVVPHVNQIAYYIGLDQKETIDYCNKQNILVEAYSPLGTGRLLDHKDIVKMAKKYEVTPAQLCIRYCLQKNTAPLPKSTHESRIIENKNVDFEISLDDMKLLDQVKPNF